MTRTATPNFGWLIPDNASENNTWGTDLIQVFNQGGAPNGIDQVVFGIQTTANAALPKAGGTMTGVIKTKGAAETVNAAGNISGAVSFNLANGQYITCTVTGAVTSVTFTNIPASGFSTPIILEITNGQSSGAWSWGAAYKWPSGTQPVMTSSGLDILTIVTRDAGTTYRMTGITKDIR